MGVHEVVLSVLGERRRRAAALALVVLCSGFGTGCDFARRSGFRLGLMTYSPDSAVELKFLVKDSKGNPLGHVAVLNQLGEKVGTSAVSSGLVTIVAKFAHSSWYFRPEMEVDGAAIDPAGSTKPLAAGRLVVLSEHDLVLAKRPIVVQLEAASALAISSDLSNGLIRSSAADPAAALSSGDADLEDDWESFRDTAPRLAGRPLVGQRNTVTFIEEDIDDGVLESDSSARSAAAASVSQLLSTLSVATGVVPEGQHKLHDLVLDRERSDQAAALAQPVRASELKVGEEALSDVPVALGETGLGTLRQIEANSDKLENDAKTAAVARDNVTAGVDSGSDRNARADRLSERRESGAQSASQLAVGTADVLIPHFPKAFARMERWGIPPEKTRRLSFSFRSSYTPAASGIDGDAAETVVNVYGISTQKESEVELGAIFVGNNSSDDQPPGKQLGRLDVVVPEAARLDLVRAELPGCGGIVTPLLASSQVAPQELSCANVVSGVSKIPSWTQTIGMMYLAHGAMRYFRGGKIDAGAQIADVSGNLSLFRLSTPVTPEGRTALPVVHLRHPDIENGESTLEQPTGFLNAHLAPTAHRLVALKNVQNPKPRVSVLVRRGHGVRHVDGALVGRFERAFFAHFVNSKFFIPVPWQTLEQQLGTSLTFEKAVADGWRGSVLDLLIDYTIVLQPRERSTLSEWYDREGKLLGHKEHPYRLDIPPELLAREVYDGLLDDLPTGNAAQTATR